jgi:hypothetical protein
VSDKSAPVIDCNTIKPITAEITNNSCRIALTLTAPKAKDNCDKDITGTAILPSTFGLGDTTITWKFVDAATNSSQCTQQITVSDKSVPVIDCSKINPITAEITNNSCRIALNITAPKAKDNCDKDITGIAVLPSTFGLGDTTITWKFVDKAGNATACTQSIKVEDKSVPVIDCSKINPITAEITNNSCRIALNITAPKAKDNCDKDITGTANLPSTFGLGDTTITWKFADKAGNATACTQSIKVEDKSVPVIDCSKINPITAEITDNACRIALTITAPIAKDNCDKDITGTAVLPSTFGLGDTTITWKFADGAGNATTCTQSVKVEDKSVPVIDCNTIQPITAKITNNSCRIALSLTAPKAKDNCDKDITGIANLPSTFGLGDTTITWKYTDGAGNATTCTQSVKVEDKSVPVIDCSKINPITAEISDNSCRIALTITAPKAKDNCDKDIMGTAVLPSTFGLGDTTITWKFVDGATNSSLCTQHITVSDKSAPVIDCSKINPITAEISDNSCRIALTITAPKAKDNCDKDIVGTAILPSTFGLGDTTITWKFADGAGNATTCTQSIKVEDRSVPVIDCNTIKPITAEISDNSCRIALNITAPKAKDNCDKDITGIAVLPSTFGLGDTTITWKFVDAATNSSQCTQHIIVSDKSAPVIDCNTIQPITAEITDNSCRIALNITAPKAKDNCDKDITGTAVLPSTFGLGDTTIIWQFVDGAGNATTCTQSIKVEDKSVPVIDCNTIQPITAEITDNACRIALNITAPTAKDNCDKDITGTAVLPSTFGLGDTTITWKFVDGATNSSQCTQHIIVSDKSVPVIDCSEINPITAEISDNSCRIALTITAPKAKDNCDKDITGTAVLPSTFGLGDTTIIWKFADNAGNATTCVQVIKVEDKSAPVIKCTTLPTIVANIVTPACRIETADVALVTPKATDNCGILIPGVLDELPASFGVGDTVLTWHFVDAAGNESTCEQWINVRDKVAPVFDCSSIADITIEQTHPDCLLSADEVALPTLVATDNCDVAVTGRLHNQISAYAMGLNTITWYFTDNAGNETACKQNITVIDKASPEVDCSALTTVTAELTTPGCRLDSSRVRLVTPFASDNCGEPIKGIAYQLPASYPLGDTVITWQFTDAAGNSTQCRQSVVVVDKSAPVPDCSAFDTLRLAVTTDACQLAISEVKTKAPVVPDNCDSVRGVLLSNLSYLPIGNSTLTWMFRDVAGNETVCKQTAVVSDKFVPVYDCSRLPVLSACIRTNADHLNASQIKLTVPVAHDNCVDIPGQLEETPASYKVGTTNLVWQFVDAAGNAATCSQRVVVSDSFAPLFNCSSLSDVVASLTTADTVLAASQLHIGVPQAVDNVDGVITGKMESARNFYPIGTTDVQWLFVDHAGNRTVCQQKVIVNDKYAPFIDCSSITDVVAYLREDGCSLTPADLGLSDPVSVDNGGRHITGALDQPMTAYPVDTTKLDWLFVDAAGNVTTCPQTIVLKDTLPPVWMPGCVDTVIYFSSGDSIPAMRKYMAIDNCTVTKLQYTDSTNRVNNPDDCGYYTYDWVRTFNVEDAHGNKAPQRTCTYRVVDNSAPSINYVWQNIEAEPIGRCQFAMPDLRKYVAIRDNSTDSSRLRIWQVPVAGSLLTATSKAKIYAEDVCGNIDSAEQKVLVPDHSGVVKLVSGITSACVSDDNPLSLISTRLRQAYGTSLIKNEDGIWEVISSTFVYDCYRDSISKASLVYSNSPYTYASLFMKNGRQNFSLRDSLTNLTRAAQSGHYLFVACDTTTRCTDTLDVDLVLKERPRIALDTNAVVNVCVDDSLSLTDVADKVNLCVDEEGAPVSRRGWLYGNTRYDEDGTLSVYAVSQRRSLVYYAENECGSSTSVNSYYLACSPVHLSAADSLAVAGSEQQLQLWRKDEMLMNRSVNLHISRPPFPSALVLDGKTHNLSASGACTVYGDEPVTLDLSTAYRPTRVDWYAVAGNYDAADEAGQYDKQGDLQRSANFADENDVLISGASVGISDSLTFSLQVGLDSTTTFYAVVSDGVCPAVPTHLFTVNQMEHIPTAITPYTHDGLNDVFMKGHKVIIFDRFGQKVFEGDDGWDGHNQVNGKRAVPDVYYYYLHLRNGKSHKGSIEVVKE